MRKAVCVALGVALGLAPLASSVTAHEREPGNIQRYGGHWRYQHRDWRGVYGHASPGICWTWAPRYAEWIWTC